MNSGSCPIDPLVQLVAELSELDTCDATTPQLACIKRDRHGERDHPPPPLLNSKRRVSPAGCVDLDGSNDEAVARILAMNPYEHLRA
jgi:hypothetical protein